MMIKKEAVSAKIQNLALYGIKPEKRLPPAYGDWFHLLLYLAWHGWNVSVEGDKAFGRDQYEKELKRQDVIKIADYPFYTPPHKVADPTRLMNLLSATSTLNVFSGGKLCGGFHPDYAIRWESGETAFAALICFGCHEIILTSGNRTLRYDIAPKAYEDFKKLLNVYGNKRPTS